MPSILVAESEGRFAERIRDGLAADGWHVETVPSTDDAQAAAAAHAPELVIVSAALPGAAAMLARFARRHGGVGAIALLSETGEGAEAAAAADESLTKPFTEQDLRLAVRRLATAGRAPRTPPVAAPDEPRMTSKDLFGDVLAEMGEAGAPARASAPAAPAAPPAAPAPPVQRPAAPAAHAPAAAAGSAEVDRVLEQTLSGLLKDDKPRPAARKAGGGVDDLLTRTLSGLDGAKAAPSRPAGAPAAPRPAGPAAPAPARTPPAVAAPPAATPRPPAPVAPPVAAAAPAPAAEKPAAPKEVDRLLESVRPAPAKAEPKRASHELDLSQLDVLAHPKAEKKPVEAAADRTPTPLATQRVTLPPALRGKASATEFGQYTLLERIAVGGMAEVWKARMKGVEGFQKTVAIKKILPHLTDSSDFVTMFVDEAKLAAQLTHNNIIHIYDLGKIGDDYFIAMEFVDGRDLRSILNTAREKGQALPMGLALLVAARLASALDYAHRMKDFEGRALGLVHRDVSPQNVLISFEGDIKLCDFGIVKAVSKASKTQMGALKGKLQYMSPEQAWGRPVDARSDIFSLGSLLFEMLTGRRLFAGESEMSVLDAVREGRIQAPRDLDPRLPLEVNALVLRALAKSPDDRFESAGAMQREIDAILASLKPPPTPHELAAYMRRLFGVEPRPEAAPAPAAASAPAAHAAAAAATPVPAPALAPVSVPVSAPAPAGFDAALAEAPARGKNLAWAALAALVVLAVAAYLVFGRGGKSEPGAPPPAAPGETTAAPGTEPAAPPVVAPAAAPAAGNEVAKIVDDEVKRREAELKKQYEAELKKKQQELAAASAAPPVAAETKPVPVATAAPAPAPIPAPVPPAASAPPPATAEPEPAPAPVEPAPVAPAPAPAPEPARPAVKAGDLVQPGPGVRLPVLVSISRPEYPPLARRMKVEGTVVLSLLVDENGRVLDVRLERGIQQNVGINEAANAAARSAKFRPATKDGVPVKIWYQLTIPFKL